MEHPASGLRDIVHGKGLAALTPAIIEASYTGNESKFADIAKLFGGKEAKDLALKIRELLKSINLNCTLSDLGIEEKDIPWMAENCMKVSAASVANNPVVFTVVTSFLIVPHSVILSRSLTNPAPKIMNLFFNPFFVQTDFFHTFATVLVSHLIVMNN